MLPPRFLSRHVAGAALSCAVLAAPRVTPAQMSAPPSAPVTVSTDWLSKHLNDPNIVLLHVGNRKEYDAGHIPGARYVTLEDISVSSHDHDNGLMLEMPKPDSLRAQLEALGISSNSRVIVYYGNDWVSPATRVIFTLDYAGLGAGSALLDGGMPAWKAENRPLSREAPATEKGTLSALKHMRKRNRGVIVQVGSALAYRAIPLQAPYCGAKFAIRGFTDSLRSELAHEKSKVHVTMVQMPALNTPQFDWCRTHLAHEPQPVPPIFAPEVAARAIVWAAHHRRRELYVGWPSLRAIWAQKLIPGVLDRYLAATGYESQQTDRPVDPNRVDNLWHTVPGDHGATGRFSACTRDGSRELWLSTHRAGLSSIAIATLMLAAAVWLSSNRRRPA